MGDVTNLYRILGGTPASGDDLDFDEIWRSVQQPTPPPQDDDTRIGPFLLSAGRVRLTDELPPEREWTVHGVVPKGTLNILAGQGGTSKTAVAITMGVAVAAGRRWAGRAVSPGGAVLLLGEEDAGEVTRRVNASCVVSGLNAAERALVAERLRVYPMAGVDFRLTALEGGNVTGTGVADDIIQLCEALTFDTGQAVQLVVVDHAKLAAGGELNAGADATALTRETTKISTATGAAVVLLAHSPKASINREGDATAADVAGNSALVDNARAALLLRTLREDEAKVFDIPAESRSSYATLELFKSNYSAPGQVTHLVRRVVEGYGTAVPVPIKLTPAPKERTPSRGLDGRVVEFVKARPGQLTRNKLGTNYGGKSGPLKASERDIERTVAALLESSRLTLRPPTDEERDTHGHTHNVRQVLAVPDTEEGGA